MKQFNNKNMIKYTKISIIIASVILVTSIATVYAEDTLQNSSSTDVSKEQKFTQKTADKISKVKSVADKQLDQRIENLGKLKDRINKFKNLIDNDKNSIIATIDGLIFNLDGLKNLIDTATSSDMVKETRETINTNYRVYALVMPQLNIIASADQMTTMISIMNIIGTKLETRINSLATSTDITSANIASARKTLTDLKTQLVDAQTNIQLAISMVAPLIPDQGDKIVMEKNQKTLKDARSKIKLAKTSLVIAKKDAEAIVKLLGRDKKIEKKLSDKEMNSTSTTGTTIPVRLEN